MSNNIGTSFTTGKSGWSTGGLGINDARNIPGRMGQPLIYHDNSDKFSQSRFTLRDAWNTNNKTGSSNVKRIITPFRAVTNSGDVLSRQNYVCRDTSCQADVYYSTNQINPYIQAAACNTKLVYDSSDYVTFLKHQAINKNYNDRKF